MTEIQKLLFAKQDIKYRGFQAPLFPNVDKEKMVGVRTPDLKKLAKELYGSELANNFIETLPHEYFDENQLHAFLISLIKDYETCLKEVDRFLPYIDNWGTCDQLSPKVHRRVFLPLRRNGRPLCRMEQRNARLCNGSGRAGRSVCRCDRVGQNAWSCGHPLLGAGL